MRYRRADTKGGTYFFTVNLADRHSDLLTQHIHDLREVINTVKRAHPFVIEAMVVLPEHLHAIWRLPQEDARYPMRWGWIFQTHRENRAYSRQPTSKTGTGNLAASLLGTSN
jgi:putative transposase